MPQYIYVLRLTRANMLTEGPTEFEAAAVDDHFIRLQRLAADGVVFLAGRTLNSDATTFGIVVFAAENPEAAAEIVAADPAVRAGVMRAELFPYQIAVWSNPEP